MMIEPRGSAQLSAFSTAQISKIIKVIGRPSEMTERNELSCVRLISPAYATINEKQTQDAAISDGLSEYESCTSC